MSKPILTINNILAELFESFSTFREKSSYDNDELLPYNVIGDFTLDFQDNFMASKLSSVEIDNVFDFLNQMGNSQDIEVQNIFVVEVLEIFSDYEETIEIARKKLNDNGKQMLEKTLKGWK
jgi:hypothetical protein